MSLTKEDGTLTNTDRDATLMKESKGAALKKKKAKGKGKEKAGAPRVTSSYRPPRSSVELDAGGDPEYELVGGQEAGLQSVELYSTVSGADTLTPVQDVTLTSAGSGSGSGSGRREANWRVVSVDEDVGGNTSDTDGAVDADNMLTVASREPRVSPMKETRTMVGAHGVLPEAEVAVPGLRFDGGVGKAGTIRRLSQADTTMNTLQSIKPDHERNARMYDMRAELLAAEATSPVLTLSGLEGDGATPMLTLDGLDNADEYTDSDLVPLASEYAEYADVVFDEDIFLAWFGGIIPRKVCDKAVVKGKHGDFLVRESSHADKFVLCVNDKGKSRNFAIEITLDRKFLIGSKQYDTLHAAIDAMRYEPVRRKGRTGKPLTLRKPAAGGYELVIKKIGISASPAGARKDDITPPSSPTRLPSALLLTPAPPPKPMDGSADVATPPAVESDLVMPERSCSLASADSYEVISELKLALQLNPIRNSAVSKKKIQSFAQQSVTSDNSICSLLTDRMMQRQALLSLQPGSDQDCDFDEAD